MSLYSDKLTGLGSDDSPSAKETAHCICRTLVEAHCTLADAKIICEMTLKMLERDAVLAYPLPDLGRMDETKRQAYFDSLVIDSQKK